VIEKPRRSSFRFWLILGAISIVVYIVGYLILTRSVCVPPTDSTAFCERAIRIWPIVPVVLAATAAIQKLKTALREINDYKARRNKWGNWRPPQ
jgi:hypothetical protein